jgi:hypothetical protein
MVTNMEICSANFWNVANFNWDILMFYSIWLLINHFMHFSETTNLTKDWRIVLIIPILSLWNWLYSVKEYIFMLHNLLQKISNLLPYWKSMKDVQWVVLLNICKKLFFTYLRIRVFILVYTKGYVLWYSASIH